jgi:LAO/AO transport system kinase
MWQLIEAGLKHRFRHHPAVHEALAGYAKDVREGRTAASVAARRLLELAR